MREAGRLIFSIADEDGWKLYVDGKETEPERFGGAFLSVHLEPGVHDIRLCYVTPGFYAGAGVSAVSILLAVCSILFEKRKKKTKMYDLSDT